MGGRGANTAKNNDNADRWDWIKDVDDRRLKNYIQRSMHLEGKADPTGRSIHHVAYWAEKELERRKK